MARFSPHPLMDGSCGPRALFQRGEVPAAIPQSLLFTISASPEVRI